MIRKATGKLAWVGILLAAVLGVSLAACQSSGSSDTAYSDEELDDVDPDQLFPDDFTDACLGAPIAAATSYDETSSAIHPIYLARRTDKGESFTAVRDQFPEAWEKDWEQAAETELVACLTPVERTLAQKCEFEEEGKPTYVLETYDTQYAVELRAAKTGQLITEETFDLKADSRCPMMTMFREGETVDIRDADYKQTLLDFVKPYVQPES